MLRVYTHFIFHSDEEPAMQNMPFNKLMFSTSISLPLLALTVASTFAHAADTAKIQPGEWRTTDTVIEMVNPLLSADMIAQRKAKPAVVEYCVRSDDLRTLLVGKDQAGKCEGSISFADGRVSISRTCTTGLGKATRKIEGTYSATKTDTMRESKMDTANGPMSSKTHVVSERIGGCK
jgi:Protein of unknown function (DUF3617)